MTLTKMVSLIRLINVKKTLKISTTIKIKTVALRIKIRMVIASSTRRMRAQHNPRILTASMMKMAVLSVIKIKMVMGS